MSDDWVSISVPGYVKIEHLEITGEHHYAVLYNAQRIKIGTFAGTMTVWTMDRVGSFATRQSPHAPRKTHIRIPSVEGQLGS